LLFYSFDKRDSGYPDLPRGAIVSRVCRLLFNPISAGWLVANDTDESAFCCACVFGADLPHVAAYCGIKVLYCHITLIVVFGGKMALLWLRK
jgi:hypothetical protein